MTVKLCYFNLRTTGISVAEYPKLYEKADTHSRLNHV